jgi:dihydroneopterin aldolase
MVSRKRKIFLHNFEMMASIGVYENERKNKTENYYKLRYIAD